jgi:hypothetical protein
LQRVAVILKATPYVYNILFGLVVSVWWCTIILFG